MMSSSPVRPPRTGVRAAGEVPSLPLWAGMGERVQERVDGEVAAALE